MFWAVRDRFSHDGTNHWLVFSTLGRWVLYYDEFSLLIKENILWKGCFTFFVTQPQRRITWIRSTGCWFRYVLKLSLERVQSIPLSPWQLTETSRYKKKEERNTNALMDAKQRWNIIIYQRNCSIIMTYSWIYSIKHTHTLFIIMSLSWTHNRAQKAFLFLHPIFSH